LDDASEKDGKMTTIHHPDHPHHKVFKEYMAGCLANPDDPPVLQVQEINGPSTWFDTKLPEWREYRKYRIKPRTITKTVTYPEPLKSDLRHVGNTVWVVKGDCDRQYPVRITWSDYHLLETLFKNGMVFSTEADAKACYDALFGEQG
jgi:hypothetical protein